MLLLDETHAAQCAFGWLCVNVMLVQLQGLFLMLAISPVSRWGNQAAYACAACHFSVDSLAGVQMGCPRVPFFRYHDLWRYLDGRRDQLLFNRLIQP